ncbi:MULTISPECIES: hypothetical protein [Streptomyces]|uniref:DNA-binding protein n=1 Tax=Streptomyces edwardsiae TaxID=3075527 RepID=A0ABU2Q015_9ACTN|nr:hypothetical protein [Streptomyces sp. DSM 41636]MDT0397278.1 hypothetical protein [Streptomyces sp. DSM 41636]
MIEDWYFCAAMRDTPHAAHAYLAVLDVLDAPVALDETLPDALEALDGCEPWTALHVVPRLLTLATAGGESADLCMEHLLGTVVGTAGGGPVGEALTAAFRACAEERPSRAAARLRHAVQVWGRDATPRTTQEPFRELTHYPRETLLLAVTAHLAGLPGAAEDIASDLRAENSWLDELTRRAARHEWGRLPFLLALRALGGIGSTEAERDRLLKALGRPAVGWADLEPDLMAAAARLLNLGTGQDAERTVTALDTDAVTLDGLRRLRRLRGDIRPVTGADRVLGRLGLPAGKPAPPALSAVLWQQVLWDLAARLHPAQAAAVLVDRWGAPGGQPRYPVRFSGPVGDKERGAWARRLTDLWQLRTGPRVPAGENGSTGGQVVRTGHLDTLRLPGVSAWAFSPWLDRARTGANASAGSGRFPAVHDPVVLLRLLSSLRTAVRLMRHGVEESRFLADLVMHGAEVLAEGRLGAYMLNLTHGTEKHEDAPLPTVLVPLALAAYRTGTYALRGVYPELHPEVFAHRAIAGADPGSWKDPTQRFYRQSQLLHQDGGALNVLVSAVLDALSGATGPQDSSPQRRWFDGEPPLAERVLDQAARGLHPWFRRHHLGNALLLLRLLLRRDVTADRVTRDRDMGRRPKTFQEVLLTPASDLATRQDRELFDSWVAKVDGGNSAVGLAGASVRLLQALSQSRGGPADPELGRLVEIWAGRMDRIREPRELARLIRWYQLQIFDVIRGDDEQESRVLSKLLDVFTEFGLRTPTDQRLLFDRLASHTDTTVRTRLLSLSYDGRLTVAGRGRALPDVWERAMYRETGQALGRQLDRLVRTLTRDAVPESGNNREFIERSWENSALTPVLRSRTVPLGMSARHAAGSGPGKGFPDVRTVVAQLAYRSSDEVVFHHLPVEPDQPDTYDLYQDPERCEEAVRKATMGKSPSLLGVVCGRTGDGGRLLVNCGMERPLEAYAYEGAQIGDPVRFQLGHDHYTGIEIKGVPQRLPVTHRAGDVRRVRVTLRPEQATASVVLADAPAFTEEDHGPLAEWDPDLSRRFSDGGGDEVVVETVARYEEHGWQPVDRGFTEFLAARLPDDDGTTGVLTLMGDTGAEPGSWRFSAKPGYTYLLPERCWEPESAARLHEEIAEAQDPEGLRCRVRVVEPEGDHPPRLALVTGPPGDKPTGRHPDAAVDGVDTRNLRWRDLCLADTVQVTRKDGGWRVEHDIPGFPDVVVYDMPPQVADTVEQSIDGWDEQAMRTGRVKARENPHLVGQQATIEAFNALHGLRKGHLVRLRAGASAAPRNGSYGAWTADGNALVSVEAESVILRPARDTDDWRRAVRGREAVVTRVTWGNRDPRPAGPRDVRAAVSTDDLLAGLDDRAAAEAGAVLEARERLDGVLLSAPPAHSGEAPRVWLRVGHRVLDVHVPWDAFTESRSAGGDQVRAFRSGRHWVFTPCRRRVFTRCLWRVTRTAKGGHTYVGASLDASARRSTYWQTHGRPGELAELSSPRQRGRDEFASAQVSLGPSFREWGEQGGGREPVLRQRAEVRLDRGRSAWGLTEGAHDTDQAWQVDAVNLRIRPVGGTDLCEVRRIFVLTEARTADADGLHDKAWPVVMKRYGWNAELRDGKAVLLPVPVDGGTRRVSLPPVPLEPDERPHVEGAAYAPKHVRVVVRPASGPAAGAATHTASYRQVPPLGLGDFMKAQNIVEGRETETSLYFVGPERVERPERPGRGRHPFEWLLFEWGYGRTLRVHVNDVMLDDHPLRSAQELPFFHGDEITRLTVTPKTRQGEHGAARDRFWLRLHGLAIRWSVERGLRDDAALGIVARLTVRLDRAANEAHVIEVQTRGGSFGVDDAGERPGEVSSPRLRMTRAGAASVLRHYPSGPDVVRVLGKLDTGRWDRSNGRDVEFLHLRPVIDGKAKDALHRGQHVFMWAGPIQPRRNDVTLDLTLELGSRQRPEPITARVTRRTFAHRENLLRRIFDGGGKDALKDTPYLVELRGRRESDGAFEGRLTNSPARRAKALLSRLTARDPSCFATVTQHEPDIRLELRAGIHVVLGRADIAGWSEVEPGMVVRVTRTADDRFRLRVALPGDSAYAVDGREAVVFPKNPLLSGRRPDARQLSQPLFVVSGLPNVELMAPSAESGDAVAGSVAQVMRHRHPKTGRLRVRGKDFEIVAPGAGGSSVSWLSVDPGTFEARLTPVVPPAGEEETRGTPIDPAQLSFADRDTRWIAGRHAGAREVPHDSRTGRWPDGRPESVVPESLDRGGGVPPVVPAAGPSLRYPPDQGRRFGFPAGHLTDRPGTPGAGTGRAAHTAHWYTVAGPARHSDGEHGADGLWLELSPGRLVELPGGLMHTLHSGSPESLEGLCWELFRPGDTVRVSAHHRGLTEPTCVVLHDWRPGLRGALGDVPAVLTVLGSDPESGALRLGGAERQLQYPVTRAAAERHAEGHTVRLTPDNRLVPWSGAPERGDAVLLGCDESGVLLVHGVPAGAVLLADEGWADDAWIRRELEGGPERVSSLLAMTDGALPVTVEETGPDGALTVSRSAQPRLPSGPGEVWQTRAWPAGRLADGRLVLRSGGALLALHPAELVPGLPADAAVPVAEALTDRERPVVGDHALWLHRTADGTTVSGLRLREAAERRVLPVAVIRGDGGERRPAGVLCQESGSGALRWLPTAHAAWAELTGKQLHECLVRPRRPVWAQVGSGGHVSCTTSASALSHFRHLDIGQPVRLLVLGITHRGPRHGRHEYLARLESNDIIVSFLSRSSKHHENERLVGEVEALTDRPDDGMTQVRTVPRNQRGTVPDLPRSVLSVAAGTGDTSFERYRELCLDPDLEIVGAGETPAGQRVVRAASHHLDSGGTGGLSDEAARALDDWIDVCMKEDWEEREVDLLPLLGATLLSAARSATDPEEAGFAVDLAYNVGERALRAVHVDPMIIPWLGGERGRAGLWGRIPTVSALMEPDELERLVIFGRSRLYRAAAEQDPELEQVARGLLLSVGEPVDPAPLLEPAGILTELSRLGRALAVPRGRARAQDRLDPAQTAFLATVFRAVLLDARRVVMPGLLFLPTASGRDT